MVRWAGSVLYTGPGDGSQWWVVAVGESEDGSPCGAFGSPGADEVVEAAGDAGGSCEAVEGSPAEGPGVVLGSADEVVLAQGGEGCVDGADRYVGPLGELFGGEGGCGCGEGVVDAVGGQGQLAVGGVDSDGCRGELVGVFGEVFEVLVGDAEFVDVGAGGPFGVDEEQERVVFCSQEP